MDVIRRSLARPWGDKIGIEPGRRERALPAAVVAVPDAAFKMDTQAGVTLPATSRRTVWTGQANIASGAGAGTVRHPPRCEEERRQG